MSRGEKENVVEGGEASAGRREHHQLSELDTHVEAEERNHDRADQKLLQIAGEPGAMHQSEHSREERPVAQRTA